MNTTRRSLSDTLTRGQRAFLTVADGPGNTPANATDGSSELSLDSERSPPDVAPGPRRITNNSRTVSPVRRPGALRSVTLRLRASVADAFRRESIKRSLDHVEPLSPQAIVEAALCAWLTDQGCQLDDYRISRGQRDAVAEAGTRRDRDEVRCGRRVRCAGVRRLGVAACGTCASVEKGRPCGPG